MPEYSEKLLKLACLLLAALLVYQVSRVVLRRDSLAHLSIPPLPVLIGDTNAATATNSTNGEITKGIVPSNTAASAIPATNSTNVRVESHGTNNATAKAESDAPGTNDTAKTAKAEPANVPSTNVEIAATPENKDTNSHIPRLSGTNATNVIVSQSATNPGTNAEELPQKSRAGSPGPQNGGAAKKATPELAPAIQARVDKIVQSEIFGQIVHPMPMALMGIAGKDVFLRTSTGQTGMVKEGDELGGVKVLQIGINRVVVEEDGQKKELTLFSGFGSPSLLADTNSPPK